MRKRSSYRLSNLKQNSPSPDGVIDEVDVSILREIGAWLADHGEAIYGSRRSPIRGMSIGKWIFKGNAGYLCLGCWPGEELTSCEIDGEIESVELLATGEKLEFDLDETTGRLTVRGLPITPPHPDINIVKVQFRQLPKPKKMEIG